MGIILMGYINNIPSMQFKLEFPDNSVKILYAIISWDGVEAQS